MPLPTSLARPLNCLLLSLVPALISAQATPAPTPTPTPAPTSAPTPALKPPAVPWYETIRVRGYAQFRYNRLLETNPLLQCEQCDRSWGENGGFFIRRARIVLQAQLTRNVFVYLQPDFSSSAGTTGNVGQIRDWYVDLGFDDDNEYRVRLGQSKVPFGFENMQSSQNRLPLDRADATNSAHANERDVGAFFMWAPKGIRERFASLANATSKGSGDYGVVAIGFFNGQTANRPEANDNQHVVARLTWPFAVNGQVVEPSIAAYGGKYNVTADQRTAGVKGLANWDYRDERLLTSINIAPRPFGLLAEYNVGRGPQYNPATDSIETHALHGGFVTVSYLVKAGNHTLFPFARFQVYDGGKKQERDARRYTVQDAEFGVEWQPNPSVEFVMEWYHGDRRFEDKLRPNNAQTGDLLRLQMQVNY